MLDRADQDALTRPPRLIGDGEIEQARRRDGTGPTSGAETRAGHGDDVEESVSHANPSTGRWSGTRFICACAVACGTNIQPTQIGRVLGVCHAPLAAFGEVCRLPEACARRARDVRLCCKA
jgi:hypothetical protein